MWPVITSPSLPELTSIHFLQQETREHGGKTLAEGAAAAPSIPESPPAGELSRDYAPALRAWHVTTLGLTPETSVS